jgi:hypothetical protein
VLLSCVQQAALLTDQQQQQTRHYMFKVGGAARGWLPHEPRCNGSGAQLATPPPPHPQPPSPQDRRRLGAPQVAEEQQPVRTLAETRRQHCDLAVGDWCSGFAAQRPIPTRPPPAGNRTCRHDCNGVGTCDHGTGICLCPAGWTGPDCM